VVIPGGHLPFALSQPAITALTAFHCIERPPVRVRGRPHSAFTSEPSLRMAVIDRFAGDADLLLRCMAAHRTSAPAPAAPNRRIACMRFMD
jgi:hypothetical protein